MQLFILFPLFIIVGGASAQNILFLNIDEKCNKKNDTWVCKKSSQCKGLKEGIKKGKIEICSFSGVDPIICCPPTSPEVTPNNGTNKEGIIDKIGLPPAIRPGKKAEEMCQEYSKYVFREIDSPILIPGNPKKKLDECAITAETLIVGGTPAKLNEFPHMALIGAKYDLATEWFCGGSLISPRFILSAAHCNVSQYPGNAIARLGDLDIMDPDDRAVPIDLKIAKVFDHPKYNHRFAYHDISLLKMERDVTLGPEIRPLCLFTQRSINREKAIASGWGRTSYGGHTSDILQKVSLDLITEEKCNRIYSFERNKLPEGTIPDLIFCAGGNKGKDTCQGDSGGPLQIAIKEPYCMYSQIGITSFGVECGENIPGGYTRVSNYIGWIENIVWPA